MEASARARAGAARHSSWSRSLENLQATGHWERVPRLPHPWRCSGAALSFSGTYALYGCVPCTPNSLCSPFLLFTPCHVGGSRNKSKEELNQWIEETQHSRNTKRTMIVVSRCTCISRRIQTQLPVASIYVSVVIYKYVVSMFLAISYKLLMRLWHYFCLGLGEMQLFKWIKMVLKSLTQRETLVTRAHSTISSTFREDQSHQRTD